MKKQWVCKWCAMLNFYAASKCEYCGRPVRGASGAVRIWEDAPVIVDVKE